MGKYILSIDQSTQGTKALLFDAGGRLMQRADLAHRQIVSERGWVSHDPEEIYANTLQAVRNVVDRSGIDRKEIAALGISNQRETTVAFDDAGKPVCDAVVWQCARAAELCERIAKSGEDISGRVYAATGIRLSPYFPGAKLAWILENVPEAGRVLREGRLRMGTMDSYLVYRLTHGRVYRTDCSNASRTQLFNLASLSWDKEICALFGVPEEVLAEITDSDGDFGETDLEGYLPYPIPIRGVLGDSHGALFGQGCLEKGMIKATYGTGSSIMMHIGDRPVLSGNGLVTSLAWRMGGRAEYVLEGNINYTGAVVTWLKDDLGLIDSAGQTQTLAEVANPDDRSYLVPAFTGLGAPYWAPHARGLLCGMSRTTGRAEIVRDALQCIAYQITDVLRAMQADTGLPLRELRVDGGPTGNRYLMQFQSDITGIPVAVPPTEELSGMGAAYAAGLAVGLYDRHELFDSVERRSYQPSMSGQEADELYAGWRAAVGMALHK
ncbi:FGGY-family carbohydrate kinase [Lachnoclostridium sp. Marseille-P6806]|uniref:FGGY-family carbohydrate kinase n=1 Tax=Lachnoclostridium sp. Marseille-P6806 TaxID=2364793 RepID=UPI0010302309|nr:glycerol kinase [Lachnoclostridium sp. Marseille-P6806]